MYTARMIARPANGVDENRVDGHKKEGSDKAGAYIGPAIGVSLSDRLHAPASYDIPISERNKGLRGAADQRVRANLA